MIIIDKNEDTAILPLNPRHKEAIKFISVQTNVATTLLVEDTGLECMRCGLYTISTDDLAVGQYTYEIGDEKGIARVIDSGNADKSYKHDIDNQVYHG